MRASSPATARARSPSPICATKKHPATRLVQRRRGRLDADPVGVGLDDRRAARRRGAAREIAPVGGERARDRSSARRGVGARHRCAHASPQPVGRPSIETLLFSLAIGARSPPRPWRTRYRCSVERVRFELHQRHAEAAGGVAGTRCPSRRSAARRAEARTGRHIRARARCRARPFACGRRAAAPADCA